MYSAFYYQLGNNMGQNQQKKTKKTPFYKRKFVRMTYMIVVHLFAIAGAAIIGAWAIYKLGLTNNSGAVDRNDRYLAEIATIDVPSDSLSIQLADADRMLKLAVINKAFPVNGRIIWEASKYCENPNIMDKMIAAAEVYVYDNAEYYIRYYGDNKVANFHLELEGFGGSPVTLDARLSVIDSPNSAGVVIDAIRYLKVARELGITGSLHGASAFTQKTPPYPMTFEDAQYECRMLANRKLTKLTQRQANRRKELVYQD